MKIEDEIKQIKFANDGQKALINIIYTADWLMLNQTNILKPFGLTPQQFNVLRILRGQAPHPATIKLIKERMLDKMSDTSRIVEKLRIKGLVERELCPANRRNVDVVITHRGLELLAKLDTHNSEMLSLMNNLSVPELQVLNNYLDKLRG